MLNKMLYKKRIERHEQCICAHPIVDGPLTLEAVVEFCHQILGSFNRPVRPKSNEVSSSIKGDIAKPYAFTNGSYSYTARKMKET